MKILFTTVLLLTIGCIDQEDESKTGSGPSTDDTSSTLDDTGDPASVEIQFEVTLDSDCVVCAGVQVSASEAVPVTLMVGESGDSLSPWAWSDAADEHLVPLIELKPETTYDVAIRVESDPTTLSDSHTFTTGALPEQLPNIRLTPDHSGQIQTGLTILSLTELKPYAEMDANFIVAIASLQSDRASSSSTGFCISRSSSSNVVFVGSRMCLTKERMVWWHLG